MIQYGYFYIGYLLILSNIHYVKFQDLTSNPATALCFTAVSRRLALKTVKNDEGLWSRHSDATGILGNQLHDCSYDDMKNMKI